MKNLKMIAFFTQNLRYYKAKFIKIWLS